MRFLIPIAVALFLLGCGPTGESDGCTSSADCAAGLSCKDGLCLIACSEGSCPAGFVCLPSGSCAAASQCTQSIDCCPAGVASCGVDCVAGNCVGNQCVPGDKNVCFDGCHQGYEICVNGTWAACDASPVEPEICHDQIDNDCNGSTDEGCPACQSGEEKPCECGEGVQKCGDDGTFSKCSTEEDCCSPGEVKSVPCGLCGLEEVSCGADGTWHPPAGFCVGEGDCSPGEEEVTACGNCALQSRTCLENCTWGAISECVETSECVPGAVDVSSCGNCGQFSVECLEDCTWGEPTSCIEDPSSMCNPGEELEQACGNCGTKVKSCIDGCSWTEYGECQNEGCAAGSKEYEACGNCGQKERSCQNECIWDAWSSCGNEGECDPNGPFDTQSCGSTTVGLCTLGLQERECKEVCEWGPWGSCLNSIQPGDLTEVCGNGLDEDCNGSDLNAPDSHEPNNSCFTCTDLGDEAEDEGTQTVYGTTDEENDSDFFCFDVSDLIVFSEEIVVELKNQPAGLDNDILLFEGMGGCANGNAIAVAEGYPVFDNADEILVWEESNSNDSGQYVIEVRPYSSIGICYEPWTLILTGLN